MNYFAQRHAAENREHREAIRALTAAIRAADAERFNAALDVVDRHLIWRRAFLAVAKLPDAPQPIREAFLLRWVEIGDHFRTEMGGDLLLMKALRVLLPPYTGEPATLYRGGSLEESRRRTYGLSWTSDRDAADGFARGSSRCAPGGSVLLIADAPASAIICAPHLFYDRYGEAEFLVDRRRLRDVRVLTRYSQISPQQLAAESTLPRAN